MKNFYCLLNGHHLIETKRVTYHIKEFKCKHCNTPFTTSQSGQITLLTDKRKEINAVLEKMHLKKIQRKKLETILL